MDSHSDKFPIFTINAERNVYDINPPYQREAGVWSQDKRRLFLDSLFNRFDVPKIYLRKVERDTSGAPRKYAVVDGKQRLTAIWAFLANEYALDDDFRLEERPELECKGKHYKELSAEVQTMFMGRTLDMVILVTEEEEEIEEMFFRLNNGTTLNAAEKRNAIGGDLIALVRELTENRFFTNTVSASTKRMAHHEAGIKFLLLEYEGGVRDLKKKFLDRFARENRQMDASARKRLLQAAEERLKSLGQIFADRDPLLRKQAYLPVYYLFDRHLQKHYALETYPKKVHAFLEEFEALRVADREKEEDQRTAQLADYDRLMQQGTNDQGSLEQRLTILTRRFLARYPEVRIRDRKRGFNDDERFAIWVRADKTCANCKQAIADLADMHADHQVPWAKGGETTLTNGVCLCETCNLSKGSAYTVGER